MKAKSARIFRGWLRDMALGALIFLMMPVASMVVGGPEQRWTLSEALAGDAVRFQSLDVVAPAHPAIENLPVAAALPQVVVDGLLPRQVSDWVVLGLTFSLLVAFNLAFLRHLRRVSASPRRD